MSFSEWFWGPNQINIRMPLDVRYPFYLGPFFGVIPHNSPRSRNYTRSQLHPQWMPFAPNRHPSTAGIPRGLPSLWNHAPPRSFSRLAHHDSPAAWRSPTASRATPSQLETWTSPVELGGRAKKTSLYRIRSFESS